MLRLLTEEVGKKSNAITLLDQEKGALIRELFQVMPPTPFLPNEECPPTPLPPPCKVEKLGEAPLLA